MRAYPHKYNPRLGVSAVRPQAAPPGMQRSSSSPHERCCFTVQCGEVSHVLGADSPEVAARWMDKINRAWLHYTSRSSRKLTTTTEGERRKHELETLQADVARFRGDAADATAREEALRAELREAKENVKRMEALVKNRTRYTVWVRTGSIKGANTSANVTVNLIGTHDRSSGDMPLEASGDVRGEELFERGVESEFTFECGHLGEITSILIGHDGSGYYPSWYVDSVRVRCERDDATWRFPVGKWFDDACHDGATYRQIPVAPKSISERDARGSCVYLVTTYTSDLKGAGTDANVTLVIHGAKGDTGTLHLAKGRDDFARSGRDQFVVEGPDIGDVSHVVVGHDNSGHGPCWHLQQLEIRDEKRGGKLSVFPCNQWFDAEHGDFQTRRTLYQDDPRNPRSIRNMVRHLVTVHTSDVPGGGTDASVSVVFNGERGRSGPHELSRGKDDFARGAVDIFTVDVEDVGDIVSIVLERDGRGFSPSWHLDHVAVTNQNTRKEYYFVRQGWIEEGGIGVGFGVSVKIHAMTKDEFSRVPKLTTPGPRPEPERSAKKDVTPAAASAPAAITPLPDPTAPIVKYAIVVKTADVRGAGTDVPCFIEINGTRNGSAVSSGPVELHNGSRSAFERGAVDEFSVHGPDFDMVTHIGLGHSSTAPGIGWRPASVELRGSRSEHAVDFIVDRIIPVEGKGLALVGFAPAPAVPSTPMPLPEATAHDKAAPAVPEASSVANVAEPQSAIDPGSTTYMVITHTSDFRGAGTDANVFVVFHGEKGDSPHVPLDVPSLAIKKNHDLFERSAQDSFIVNTPSTIGKLSAITIEHDSGGRFSGQLWNMKQTWHLDHVEILELEHKDAEAAMEAFRKGEEIKRPIALASSPLFFDCKQWFGWSAPDKLQSRKLEASAKNPAIVKADYVISIRTADERGAGSDASARVKLKGSKGETGTRTLNLEAYDTATEMNLGNLDHDVDKKWFERNSVDTFVLRSVTDVGEVNHITMSHDGCGHDTHWKVHSVVVRRLHGESGTGGRAAGNPKTLTFVPTSDAWLKTARDVLELDPAVGVVEDDHRYKVTVQTADEPGASTDADVYVIIRGTKGELPKRTLFTNENGTNPFERGAIDVFHVTGPAVGEIYEIEVGHNNKGRESAWKMHSMQIADESTGMRLHFHCDAWFDASSGDGVTKRTIAADKNAPKAAHDMRPASAASNPSVFEATASNPIAGAGNDERPVLTSMSPFMHEESPEMVEASVAMAPMDVAPVPESASPVREHEPKSESAQAPPPLVVLETVRGEQPTSQATFGSPAS